MQLTRLKAGAHQAPIGGANHTPTPTQVEGCTQELVQGLGHDHGGGADVDKVDHEKGQGSHGGQLQLVAPAQVQDVIGEAQEYHAADGEQGGNELDKLSTEKAGNVESVDLQKHMCYQASNQVKNSFVANSCPSRNNIPIVGWSTWLSFKVGVCPPAERFILLVQIGPLNHSSITFKPVL